MDFSALMTQINEVVWLKQLVIFVGSIVAALIVSLFMKHIVHLFTRKTETDVDDRIVAAVKGPVVTTIVLIGFKIAFDLFDASGGVKYVVDGIILTVVALLWARAGLKVGQIFFEVVSQQVDRIRWIEPRTLPLLDMVLKVVAVAGFLYFVCIAWHIPLTSWLTSAGVLGIAVGFAAKDTLSNLFSGIFIVADTPYEIGDFVVLDNKIRGQVLEIGMRSTRLVTRDDIEITVPNAVIANAQIINQTGGPHEKMRVRIKVEAAYGSDVDQVEEVLLGCVDGVANVCERPAPRVRFREFGASGLVFELLAWIDEPVYRGRVMHVLNGNVYKSLNAAGIEIPYAKQDVYVKEMPRPS